VHRRSGLAAADRSARDLVPVTSPARTLIDIAVGLEDVRLEALVNEADRRELVNPEALMVACSVNAGQPGVGALRRVLNRQTFRFTDSELERRFLKLVGAAGLPPPLTQVHLNGFRVDFHWPELGLVVETDGLRYHRTPGQQARDRLRDQAHAAKGLVTLRFTHAQVRYDAAHVRRTLLAVTRRCRRPGEVARSETGG
jgi:very-short-patch-repair endonuclease